MVISLFATVFKHIIFLVKGAIHISADNDINNSKCEVPDCGNRVLNLGLWPRKRTDTMRPYNAASPSLRSIWSKCHSPASQPSKRKVLNADEGKRMDSLLKALYGKQGSGIFAERKEKWQSWFKIWIVPCPFPTLLNWATYSEILLMASTCKSKKYSHFEVKKHFLSFLIQDWHYVLTNFSKLLYDWKHRKELSCDKKHH